MNHHQEQVPAILPPAMLGMLGGGQLGRFFVVAAHEMGYKVTVLDPDANSPAGQIADVHICAAFDDKSAFVTSGIRVGVPAITSRGMKASDMEFVVNAIDTVLMNADNETKLAAVRSQVNEFMAQFPLYPELG